MVLYEFHDSPTVGHSRFVKTYDRVFFFLGQYETCHMHLCGRM
jgi:hypothetical protein